MTNRCSMVVAAMAAVVGIGGAGAVYATVSPSSHLSTSSALLNFLDSPAATYLTPMALRAVADQAQAPVPRLGISNPVPPPSGTGPVTPETTLSANVRVNNPAEDLQVDQTTQSETSVAVNGTQVVVGFNDSQKLLDGRVFTAGADLTGYAYSTDGGASFTDGGVLPNAPGQQNVGDPAVAADRAGNFYYATLSEDFSANSLNVVVAKSADGGKTWSTPVRVNTLPPGIFQFDDKDAIAVGPDPTTPSQDDIYVGWDAFSFSSSGPSFGPTTSLHLAHSTDGGRTWADVTVARFTPSPGSCSFQQFVGADPVVDTSNGTVVLSAEKFAGSNCVFPPPPPVLSLKSFTSTNGGSSFGPETVISFVTSSTQGTGAFELGPGMAMRNAEFPSMAFASIGIGKSALFTVWNDGGARDHDSHLRLASSTNDGTSWNVVPGFITAGPDEQVQPAASGDAAGLHILAYEIGATTNPFVTPASLDVKLYDVTKGTSVSSTTRVNTVAFPGVLTDPQFDPVVAFRYMGDYIANVSLAGHQYLAWGDNRDIVSDFMFPGGRHDPDVFFAIR